jgi:hypothetical protein
MAGDVSGCHMGCKGVDWIRLAQDAVPWWNFVRAVLNCMSILTSTNVTTETLYHSVSKWLVSGERNEILKFFGEEIFGPEYNATVTGAT